MFLEYWSFPKYTFGINISISKVDAYKSSPQIPDKKASVMESWFI